MIVFLWVLWGWVTGFVLRSVLLPKKKKEVVVEEKLPLSERVVDKKMLVFDDLKGEDVKVERVERVLVVPKKDEESFDGWC